MTSDETQFSLEDWNVRSLLVRPCVLAMTLLAVAGCGQNCQRVSVDGNVTLDGKPLAEGAINFIPQLGTAGPTAGAAITEGRFSIERDRGTFTGMFRVEITATRKTGRQKRGPLGNMVDEYEQLVPARYNRQSELTVEVMAEGPHHFEFALDSKPAN